jgi:bifunctional non-homologous end joining protein LigD
MKFKDFPAPEPVPLPIAIGWQASPDWTFEMKADGKRAKLANGELRGRVMRYRLPGEVPAALADCALDGELVGNVYFAFDVIEADGEDLRRQPLRERKAALLALQPLFPDWLQLIPTARPGQSGGEYLQGVLRDGGEGCVVKNLNAPYGCGWYKAKRLETFDALVAELDHARGSIRLTLAGGDCGWLPCRAAFDRIRLGDVVEVAAVGRHASGKLREARFIKVRTDKPAAECVTPPRQM